MAKLYIKNSSSRPSNHLEVTYIGKKRRRGYVVVVFGVGNE